MNRTEDTMSVAVEKRDKVIRLLRYLVEFVKMRIKVSRTLEDYQRDGLVIWFNDIPQAPGCTCPLWSGEGESKEGIWLELKKQRLTPHPDPGDTLKPWIDCADLGKPDGKEPRLRCVAHLSTLEKGKDELFKEILVACEIEDFPEITSLWNSYYPRWQKWAEENRPKAIVQQLYGELFRSYQLQLRLGEVYEFILGFGLLSWSTPGNQVVKRHIVAAHAELKFDDRRGVISVECPPHTEGAGLCIEDEFLEPGEKPAAQHYSKWEEQLADLGDAVWDTELQNIMEAWGTALNPDTVYSNELSDSSTSKTTPHITYAPALILRKRTAHGTLVTYQKILQQISEGKEIPFGVRRLVGHLEDDFPSAPADEPPGRNAERPEEGMEFFSLPTNAEQRRILEELRHRHGILVQGPPGTGKSHTIANLICHFLAHGKRVLVTSETPRALQVLKNKLPEAIRPLCVSLLGADTASFSELERSVSGIGRRKSYWNMTASRRRIEQLRQQLNESQGQKSKLDRELREYREAETKTITLPCGNYHGTAAAIGRRVNEERSKFKWMPIEDKSGTNSALTNAEALSLLQILRRTTGERERELGKKLALSAELPNASNFADMVQREKAAATLAGAHADYWSDPAFKVLLEAGGETRTDLRKALESFVTLRNKLQGTLEGWIKPALIDLFSGKDATWRVLQEKTRLGLQGLQEMARKAEKHRVVMGGNHPRMKIRADARIMIDHLKAGKKWSFLGIALGPARGRKYLRKQVIVDGHPADSIERLDVVVHRIETEQRLHDLWITWQMAAGSKAPGLEMQAVQLAEQLQLLDQVHLVKEYSDILTGLLRGKTKIPTPDWLSQRPDKLLDVVEAANAQAAELEARAITERALGKLNPICSHTETHPVNLALRKALTERNVDAWTKSLQELIQLENDQQEWKQALQLRERLEKKVPRLLVHLYSDLHNPEWASRFANFEEAWHWANADLWIHNREAKDLHRVKIAEIQNLEKRLGSLKADLAAEHAWNLFLTRLTQAERENLEAWQLSVQKIGKGTGKKRAGRYRSEARKYLGNCVQAIPAWIVPRYRIAEVLEPQAELFDVVIIDEASQTGIDGLYLYYLGKQTIVVGDNQQISPYGIGMKEDMLVELQQRFLQDIPFHTALGATSSLYDHAKIRFEGKIVLREHFRCMPEIIQFSNDLCYAAHGTPLIPLKTYPPNRLQPVVTRFVEKGFQKGATGAITNPQEAASLVAQLVACCKDERYKGKTFGVISLVGEQQAHLIQKNLAKILEPEEIEKRALVCGDAYAFQGDERDVIFLSMVSAPNAHLAAMTGESARQRFNVAASRAREQMWLFHSIKPEDVSHECVRHRLLTYCLNPMRDPVVGIEDEFESDFERAVCEQIRSRGYRVCTQVPGGDQSQSRYRIDLVVEGMTNRLALECDGDRWHGPEAYDRDMDRQRQLERAGWKFFRIAGGSYYADPEGVLVPLWKELDQMGIKPGVVAIPGLPPPDSQQFSVHEEEKPEEEKYQEIGLMDLESDADEELPSEGEDVIGCGQTPEVVKVATPFVPTSSILPLPQPKQIPISKGKDLEVDRRYVEDVPGTEWYQLSRWAKEQNKLKPWQRGLVYTVGRNKSRGWDLTDKQYKYAAESHREAIRLGFVALKPAQLPRLF